MGRKKKYFTDEEKRKANNDKVKSFYRKNKSVLDAKSRANYWRNKIKKCIKDGDLNKAKLTLNKALLKGIKKEFLKLEEIDDRLI